MNSRTLIFSKRFPKITKDMLNEFEDVPKSDNADTDFPKTGEEFISYIEENTKYVFNDERAKHKDEFIALVKELSENYEIDTDLYEVGYGYIAYLHWDFAIIRIKSYYQNKSEISVCRIYSKISKDRLRRVGGLFLCLEIFDFDLSFLG